jgi:hypothetical protein
MGAKKELIILILLLGPLATMSQICDSSKRDIQPLSKWYLNDTCFPRVAYDEIADKIAPKDTAIVRQMIGFGSIRRDFEDIFREHSIAIKKISIDSFVRLTVDPIVLTGEEEKVEKRLDEILDEMSIQDAKGKSTKKLDEELKDPKFSTLFDRIYANKPILFYMYPIYSLNGKRLIMYMRFGQHRSPHSFHYEICEHKVMH